MFVILFIAGATAASAALYLEPIFIRHRPARNGRALPPRYPLPALVPLFGVRFLAGSQRLPPDNNSQQVAPASERLWRTPLAPLALELLLAAIFTGLGWRLQDTVVASIACAYCALLFQISLIDLHYRLILNQLTYAGAVLALAGSTAWHGIGPGSAILGGGVALAFFLLLELGTRGGMGRGDTKLAGLIGIMRGYPAIWSALSAGIILGGIVSGVLLLAGRSRRERFPYGPWLAAGAVISLFLTGRP